MINLNHKQELQQTVSYPHTTETLRIHVRIKFGNFVHISSITKMNCLMSHAFLKSKRFDDYIRNEFYFFLLCPNTI